MNNLIFRNILAGGLLVVAIACPMQRSSAQTPTVPSPATNSAPVPVAAENFSRTITPPPSLYPNSPLAQVVRLTQAGVDPGVIMTFITNSSSTFNLDSEKIIYASDAGVPSSMVTAMMERDQILQQQFAEAQAAQQVQPTPPAQPAPATEPAPTSTTDTTPQPEAQPVTVNYFYNSLAPYGSWIVINGYGRCWRPTTCVYDPSWQPYCDRGRWVYTDCGWYWNSDYAWGATFHYGRWFRNPSYGWCWYPDTVWGPSWVTWRRSNNYCGWAPLPPGTACQAGVGIVYNGGNVSAGFGFGLGANCYTFVPTAYFCNPHPRNYCVAPTQVTQVYNNTTVINNYNVNNRVIVNHGIAVNDIAAANRMNIQPVPVRQITAGYAHAGYGQPAQGGGAHQTGDYRGNGVAYNAAHNNYSSPAQNWTAQPTPYPQHNMVVATIPQRQLPIASSPVPTQEAPVENLNAGEHAAPVDWQANRPNGTPRSTTHYTGTRQIHSVPQHIGTPPAAPVNAPTASPGQGGGYHGGYSGAPGH